MYRLKKHEVWASEVAEYLNSPLHGSDFILSGPGALKTPVSIKKFKISTESSEEQFLLLGNPESGNCNAAAHIESVQPEVDLANILLEFFASISANSIHPSAIVSKDSKIGRNVMIGAHSIIGPEVEIGDNTKILNNVVISGTVKIGKYCVVKDGAVIGSEGYGFIDDQDKRPVQAPHLGKIVIGDRVWIGSNGSIEMAMVEETILEDDVKIDDLVHIGNSTRIGMKTMVTAGVVIASNVDVGCRVRISPKAVIRDSVTIADDVVIGQGAVVVSDLTEPAVFVGVPAKKIKS